MMRHPLILAGASLCSLAASSQVYAQTAAPAGQQEASGTAVVDEGEIVVSARRRNELLQDVPIAVTAITQETAIRSGINGMEALTIATPNLDFSRQISVGATPFLRGVGSTQSAAGGESPVAVYVDDVYIGSPNGNMFAFNNISSVQVLKGPQGTLFGRNATGGVIQVQTRRPSFTPAMEASFGYGNYNSVEGSFYATTGLTDKLAINIAASGRKQNDGFGHSVLTGKDTLLGWDWDVRSQLLWQPTDTTKLLLIGNYGEQKSDFGSSGEPPPGFLSAGGAHFVGPYNTMSAGTDNSFIKRGGVSLRIDQELSFADLVSISAYQYTRIRWFYDQDQNGSFPGAVIGPVNTFNKTFTQEFQLLSKPESRLRWILGLYYLHTKTGYDPSDVAGTFISGFTGNPANVLSFDDLQKLNSYSAFGEVGYEVLPKTNLTLGLRYTSDQYDLVFNSRKVLRPDGSVFSLPGYPRTRSDTFSKVTYRAILDHKFAPDIMGYASYSRGFRSGGYQLSFADGGTAATPLSAPVRPEVLDAYEVGLKTKLFDGKLTLNGAAFYYDYTNLAIAYVVPGGTQTINAAAAHIKGLDIDFIATPFSGLRIGGGIGVLDGKYTDFPNGPIVLPKPATCTPTPTVLPGAPTGGNLVCTKDLSGNRAARAPKFTLSLSPSYTFETGIGSIILAGSYYHNSGFFWDVANTIAEPSYDIFNASLTWESTSKNFSVRLWGKNLSDKQYAGYRTADIIGYRVSYAAPRTYGVTGTVKF